jgi:uncharacterized protein
VSFRSSWWITPHSYFAHTCAPGPLFSRHAAASYGNADVLRYLISKGARIDIVDVDGDSPLHSCETAECASLLLDAGANLTALNSEGHTPYHIAVLEHREEMIEWLTARYAERDIPLPVVEPEDEEDDDEMGGEDGDE